jgi:RNA-directed DNA polymerase
METKLRRISEISQENPKKVFTSIGHLINKEMLINCHREMDKNKAAGIDGVSKGMYEQNLDENLERLVESLKHKSYRPQPVKRVHIPKDNGKTRPLGIAVYEDKLVQQALKKILEAVFEPLFGGCMYGFRPGKSCHDALKRLNTIIQKGSTSYILDADIEGFFNHIDHEWMIKFVEVHVKDPNIIRLIRRLLKAGISENGIYKKTEEGSEQGSVCSPILANIYMHYVLVLWFYKVVKPGFKGYCEIVVYADDFVCCFQYKKEAEQFYAMIKERFGKFGLKLEESKSRLIEFGRFAEANRKRSGEGKPETFDFLGFTHYCSKSRKGYFRLKRKTSKKKFRAKLKLFTEWVKQNRNLKKKELIEKLNVKLAGYYRYYGITDNFMAMDRFWRKIVRTVFIWLNRRSQRKSYTWKRFYDMLKYYPIMRPRIYVNIYEI